MKWYSSEMNIQDLCVWHGPNCIIFSGTGIVNFINAFPEVFKIYSWINVWSHVQDYHLAFLILIFVQIFHCRQVWHIPDFYICFSTSRQINFHGDIQMVLSTTNKLYLKHFHLCARALSNKQSELYFQREVRWFWGALFAFLLD